MTVTVVMFLMGGVARLVGVVLVGVTAVAGSTHLRVETGSDPGTWPDIHLTRHGDRPLLQQFMILLICDMISAELDHKKMST